MQVLSESVLMNQVFVMDSERKVEKVIEDEAKSLGTAIRVTGFVRMELGEGIEKKTGILRRKSLLLEIPEAAFLQFSRKDSCQTLDAGLLSRYIRSNESHDRSCSLQTLGE